MAKAKNPFIDKEDAKQNAEQETLKAAPEVKGIAEQVQQKVERVYKNAKTIHHDLFMLKSAKFQKNLAVTGSDAYDLVPVDHCHFFHTVNSEGKEQTNSSQIAGHFHVMKIVKSNDGPPKVTCATGPMMWGRKAIIDARGKKKFKTVIIPINEYDTHTHEVEYLRSSEIKQRVMNSEAVQVETHWGQYAAPPKDVI